MSGAIAMGTSKITGLGTPTANTTDAANTAYVDAAITTAITNVINSAPGALDTLDELAAALGDDANFASTVTTSIATKLPLAGGTMTGAIAMGTNKITGLGTPTVNTDAATKAYVDGVTIAPSNLTGPITSVGAATTVAAQTGTGSTFVMDTSPTLVTPVLGVATATSINGTTIPASKTLVATDSTQYVVPSQTSNSGKYLTTNGTVSSWAAVDSLPSQTGNAGEFLTTDGTTASWAVVAGSLAQPTEPTSPNDGQIWVDTDGTAPTTVVTRWSKSPTNGTTTLSGTDDTTNVLAYTPGYEQVFLNGVLLSRGSDYTATTGTSVVLTTGTVTSDIVEIIAALQVAYTDAITTTAAANTYVAKALTTTTGDIIYASAANTPARLGIGSSAQVLTVSGGIPAWATPAAGGLTKISSNAFSNVASVTIDGCFTSTYTDYLVIINNISAATTTDDLLMQLRYGSTTETGAVYYGSSFNVPFSGATSTIQTNAGTSYKIANGIGSATYAGSGQMFFSRIGNSNQPSTWRGQFLDESTTDVVHFSGKANDTRTYTGLVVKSSSSNISGNITIYGLAN